MDDNDNDYVLAFDHFYTTNHIQILKSLLPFIDSDNFGMLPAIIKYMELKYTLSLINKGTNHFSGDIHACSNNTPPNLKAAGDPSENIENIYKAVHKYLAPNEEKSFNQILSAFRTMKNVREMQQMMELFQSLNPDIDPNAAMENIASGNMNFNDMDLSELMKLFGGNNNGDK